MKMEYTWTHVILTENLAWWTNVIDWNGSQLVGGWLLYRMLWNVGGVLSVIIQYERSVRMRLGHEYRRHEWAVARCMGECIWLVSSRHLAVDFQNVKGHPTDEALFGKFSSSRWKWKKNSNDFVNQNSPGDICAYRNDRALVEVSFWQTNNCRYKYIFTGQKNVMTRSDGVWVLKCQGHWD